MYDRRKPTPVITFWVQYKFFVYITGCVFVGGGYIRCFLIMFIALSLVRGSRALLKTRAPSVLSRVGGVLSYVGVLSNVVYGMLTGENKRRPYTLTQQTPSPAPVYSPVLAHRKANIHTGCARKAVRHQQ